MESEMSNFPSTFACSPAMVRRVIGVRSDSRPCGPGAFFPSIEASFIIVSCQLPSNISGWARRPGANRKGFRAVEDDDFSDLALLTTECQLRLGAARGGRSGQFRRSG